MLKIQCLIISKPNRDWDNLIQHYLRLLKSGAVITHRHIAPEKINNVNQRASIRAIEAGRLRNYIKPADVLVVCTERGKAHTSTEFAEKLAAWSNSGQRRITFVIGGPLGIDPTLEQAATHQLALAKFTLPHDLAHVVLLEQLYRATTILSGKTYHY